MARLEGKIALITGASRGIGAETARLFAKEGAKVIVTDILDEGGIALVESLENASIYKHLDVSNEEEWINLTDWLSSTYGGIDILFNNAGIMHYGECMQDPENTTLESWRTLHQINLDSVFMGCKYGIKLMKKRKGGSIINMSSRSGVVGVPHAAAYSSSKAAIKNYTKSVALYCAEKGYNIRCNALLPAAILTSIWEKTIGTTPELRESGIKKLEKGIPLGKMGEPIDVAYAALYLASDEAKYITGTELVIDGGILAGSQSAPKSNIKN